MYLLPDYINLNDHPPEKLKERYVQELSEFESWFTKETNKQLVHKVFDALFYQKYVITYFHGNKKWKLK